MTVGTLRWLCQSDPIEIDMSESAHFGVHSHMVLITFSILKAPYKSTPDSELKKSLKLPEGC